MTSVSFKAGKMNLKSESKTLTADTKKGTLSFDNVRADLLFLGKYF